MGGAAEKPAWPAAYEELRAYVAAHRTDDEGRPDGIRVSPTSLSVPRDLRPEFYGLVDRAQRALAAELLGPRADEAASVARRCTEVRRRLCERSGLREFRLASMLESLLADPEAELARPLFSTVLEGVQGNWGANELEERARRSLLPHVDLLVRNAYEAWAYYGVVASLHPTAFYGVFSPDFAQVQAVPTEVVTVATQASSPTCRLPEAVFTTADGRVFAMKSEAARELDYYGFKLKRRRDTSAGGDTANLVAHRALLLWQLPSVDAVGVVADREKMRLVPPDLFCEVLQPADMATPAYVSAFVERVNAVRSRRPVQVLTPAGEGAFPEGMLADPTVAPIQVRAVGLDEDVLAQVAGLLAE